MAPSRPRPAERLSRRAAGRIAPVTAVTRHPTFASTTLAAAVALTVAGCGSTPPTTPARTTPQPTPSARTTPTIAAPTFAYGAGSTTFDVTVDGTVATEGDSATPLHVATTTRVSLAIGTRTLGAANDAPRPVLGSVDAFTTPSARATPMSLHLPLAISGTLDARRHRTTLALTVPQPADTACLATALTPAPGTPPPRPMPATPALSLLATARDLLVAPPEQLAPGTHWDEENETIECRGLVAVTTHTRYRYEVRGSEAFGGVATAIRVGRASESESRGERASGRRTIHIRGASHGTFDLYLDPTAGRSLGGSGQSNGTLEVDAGDGRTRRFAQTFTTRIVARPHAR